MLCIIAACGDGGALTGRDLQLDTSRGSDALDTSRGSEEIDTSRGSDALDTAPAPAAPETDDADPADFGTADTAPDRDAEAAPVDAFDETTSTVEVVAPSADPFERGVTQVTLLLEPLARGLLANDPLTSVPALLRFDDAEPVHVRVTLPTSDSQRDFTGKPTFSVRFDLDSPLLPPYTGLSGVGLLSMVDDPSHLRARLVTHIARRAGLEVPRSTFARLHLDGGDEGPIDLGLYTMTEALTSPAYLERAVAGGASHSIFEPRDRGDLWPWQISELALVLGDETQRAVLTTLAERLETFRVAHLSGEPLTLFTALEGMVDLSAFTTSMAFDIALGHTVGYGRNVWQFALHVGLDGRVTFLPKQLGASLEPGDVPNPWFGGGKLLWHCRDDADCRALLGEKLAAIASTLGEADLIAEASALRFLALTELQTDDRREADDETVTAAQADVLQTLAERGPWLVENLACAAPAAVDRDGDGASACTTDCDDDRADVHPGAVEQCNLRDDDCDGVLDDDPSCEPCVLVEGPYVGTTWALCHRPLSWVAAREDCLSRGGDLVSIASEDEQKVFLRKAMGLQWVSWWIGLSDLGTEGAFAWADGAPVAYSHWNEGEPNDYGGREDCAELMPWGGGLWNDLPCDRDRPYVCAIP